VFYRRADGERETEAEAARAAAARTPRSPTTLEAARSAVRRRMVRQAGHLDSQGISRCGKEAGLGVDVTPHVLRHTAATWLMQAGTDPWEAAGFLGMTVETLMSRYGHHHPDYLSGARGAFSRHRNRHRNAATEREQTETNVTKIAEFSKVGG
jgi:hypothetical protein